MVAAVSAVVSQASDSTASREAASYHWFKMPDLNRATHRRLGQSGAGWTFETICRLVHHVGRVGRPKAKQAARDLGRLGVGLQAIADEAGISVAKVRRDLVKLVDLGLVAVIRRNVEFKLDPASGKIIENRKGRSLPVVVMLNVGPEHLRQKAGTASPAASHPRMAPLNPVTVAGPGAHDRDHSGGAIQRDEITKRTPSVDAVGIGTPPAGPGAGLPAGEAGGHSAAEASQEGGTSDFLRIVTADPESAGLPPGRLAPQGKATRPQRPQRRPGGDQEGGTTAAEYAEAWHRRDPEEERQRAEYQAAKAAKRAAREAMPEGQAAPPTTTAPPPSLDQEASRNAWRAALAREVG